MAEQDGISLAGAAGRGSGRALMLEGAGGRSASPTSARHES